MPLYERRNEQHEVVERVHTVAGSRNDERLAASDAWKLVAEDTEQAPAPAATAAPLPKRTTAKPPAPSAEG
jgi:hypothetical protein